MFQFFREALHGTMAVPAYYLGLARLILHIVWKILSLSDQVHLPNNQRWWRGNLTLRRIEVACSCGRRFFVWWSEE